jgi:hypothetical protein
LIDPPARVCGICGTACRPAFRAPAPELAPDLDLRPGEPTRSTLPKWLQTCRGCGAVAPDLAVLTAEQRPMVESAAYRGLNGPGAATGFLRWARLCADATSRGEAMLQAAWAADDADAASDAAGYRREAAAAWAEPVDTEGALRLLDVLRRAGAFAEAAALAERLGATPLDENSARIVAFQQARIGARDSGRHLISSALRPPAHRPHVAQQRKPSKRGFWGALMGRGE